MKFFLALFCFYLQVTNSAGFLLDSMFDFADRMNALQLTDEEVALFSAIVIIASGMGLALQRYSELL